MKGFLLTLLLFFTGFLSYGADIVSVSGESVYYDDGTKSKVECMRLAAEQARIDALARRFGTVVSQDILQSDRLTDGREHNDFLSLSSSEVKGEWIADDGEPVYEFSHDKAGNMIVTCRLKGKAREISNNCVLFDAMVLRNGTDLKNADNLFRDGDDMFLYFKGAANGHVALFLEDESRQVYLLLPYPKDSKTSFPVAADKEYIFFDPRHALPGTESTVEELVLTAPDRAEFNRLFVVYSPDSFSRPAMSKAGELPAVGSEEFNRWLVKARRNDPKMGVRTMNLRISPK